MKVKIVMTGDRKVTQIESENFSITLNGLDNAAYKAALAPLGIELVFHASDSQVLESITTSRTPGMEKLERIMEGKE